LSKNWFRTTIHPVSDRRCCFRAERPAEEVRANNSIPVSAMTKTKNNTIITVATTIPVKHVAGAR
jgi:hypothetical protein